MSVATHWFSLKKGDSWIQQFRFVEGSIEEIPFDLSSYEYDTHNVVFECISNTTFESVLLLSTNDFIEMSPIPQIGIDNTLSFEQDDKSLGIVNLLIPTTDFLKKGAYTFYISHVIINELSSVIISRQSSQKMIMEIV